MRRFLLALALLLTPTVTLADAGHSPAPRVEGPADEYVYELAAPGTYELPPIRQAADARLLDSAGSQVRLARLFERRLTVLAFMYTRCGDVCPLATLRLADLQRLAAADAALSQDLQIVSLSFDPDYDTPEVMAEFGAHMRLPDGKGPPWLFLTAADCATLAPVLEAYDQPVARKADPDDPKGPLAHLLRVFLIDGDGVIRNIYSADFLDPRLLLNDLKTLQMEGG